jgi:outer membrane immunogenic protein
VFCNKTLVYGKFGYAWQPKMETELKDTVTNTTAKKSYSRNGLVLGAGVEHALTNNWLVRGEYKYNFGTKSKNENLNFAFPHKNEVKTSAHTLTLGVAYKF